jgi:sporulation protein YlmC with PRC-barrel domain
MTARRHIGWHDVVGRRVFDAEGKAVGHVADLIAVRDGRDLVVDALVVGPRALLARFGVVRGWRPDANREIPWALVADFGEVVRLRQEEER